MARRLLAVLTLAALFAAGCVSPPLAPPDEPTPVDGAAGADDGPRNLFLLDGVRPFNARVSGGAEPMVLVDKDGRWVWVGDTSGLYRSADGGQTWQRSPNPFLPGVFGDGWALAQDEAGTLYASTTQGQFIGVASSTDGGATWSRVSPVVHAGSIADRPWLAARGDGEVAVVQNGDLGEDCAFSNDGGQTFLTRALANAGPTNAGNLAFDSEGHLYYAVGSTILRWAKPCQGAPLPHRLPPSGAQIFTQVAIDGGDNVYVAEPSPDNARMEIRAILGSARNTQKSLVISPPDLKSNTFAAIAARGDEVAVAWYGSETPGNPSANAYAGAWNVFVARVTGFWTASPQVTWTRLTDEPNHVGDFCMNGIGCTTGAGDRDLLDYFGVAYGTDGALHVAYGHDGTGSRPEVRYALVPAP